MFKTIIPHKDKVWINGLKEFIKPFWYGTNPPNHELDLAATIGATALAPITVSQEGPFQGWSLICDSTLFQDRGDHAATMIIIDDGSKKQWMNAAIHVNAICGTPQFPGLLSEPGFMNETRSFRIKFNNLVAEANSLRFLMHGRRMYNSSANDDKFNQYINKLITRTVVSTPYFLTTEETISQLEPDASAYTSYFFPTDMDAYMEVFKISAVAYEDDTGLLTGNFDFELRDAETGRGLSNVPLSNTLATGNAQQPHELAESWLIPPNQRVELQIRNTLDESSITVYFALCGRKIYV